MRAHSLFFMPLMFALIAGCGESLCGNEVIIELPSPSKNYVATVLERNCGATTPYVRVVALRPFGSKLNAESFEDWVFTAEGQPAIEIKWEDDNTLEIKSSGGGRPGTRHDAWKQVKISYQ